MSEDSDHRDSLTDGGSDPGIDVLEQGTDWLLTRHGVKAIASPDIVRLKPPVFEASQDALVRRVVSQQDTDLVMLETRGEEVRGRVELLLLLPEVADMVTGRRECVRDTQRNTPLTRASIVKAMGSKETHESGFLSAIHCLGTPELPE
jgi:hypothetical protein